MQSKPRYDKQRQSESTPESLIFGGMYDDKRILKSSL